MDGLREGLTVLSGSGGKVGTVKEVQEDRFHVDRELQPDVWLPIAAISAINERHLILLPQSYEIEKWAFDDEPEQSD